MKTDSFFYRLFQAMGPRGDQGDVGFGYRIETDPVLSGSIRGG